MTGLWTNDRDTLALFLSVHTLMDFGAAKRLLEQAKADGVVRVLDPDDTVQRGRVAKRLREIEVQAVAGIHRDDTDWAAGELIKALRQP
jgi:hypothetical protein